MMLLMAAVVFMAAVLHGKISSLLLLCLASPFEPSMLLLCMVVLLCLLHLPESSFWSSIVSGCRVQVMMLLICKNPAQKAVQST